MILPTRQELEEAVIDYQNSLGAIASVDFSNGINWVIEKIKERNDVS